MAGKRSKKAADFKPDSHSFGWLKVMHMTIQQRQRLLRWGLYALTIIVALVIQDVVMSRVSILGATTDLAVGTILLITVMEGTEVGSIFVLIASTLYFYSGSAPGAYCIALMTFLGVGATMFRQMYLHRSRGSIVICAGIAQMGYNLGLYALGLFLELTRWDRLGTFVLSGLLNVLIMIPLYLLIYKIGLIGGNTWKE